MFSIVPTLHGYGVWQLEKWHTCGFLFHFADRWTRFSTQFFKRCITGSRQSTHTGINHLLSLTMLLLKLIRGVKLVFFLFFVLINLYCQVVTYVLDHLIHLTPSCALWFVQPSVAPLQKNSMLVACQKGMGKECSKEIFQRCRTHHYSTNAWWHNVRDKLQCWQWSCRLGPWPIGHDIKQSSISNFIHEIHERDLASQDTNVVCWCLTDTTCMT